MLLCSCRFSILRRSQKVFSRNSPICGFSNNISSESLKNKPSSVAVVGAGQIGTAVTKGLRKGGYKVFVCDPCDTNRAELENAGAIWKSTHLDAVFPDELNLCVDVVITAVPAPPQVRDVMEGKDGKKDGLLNRLSKDTIWIDHTTTHPEEARRLAKLATDVGIHPLEAPLTGGYALLCAGMMTVLVGGESDLLEKCSPLMRQYAETILHMGEIGQANVVKLITNQLAATHLVASAEAVMMARQSGINLDAFFDGVRASAGNSYVFETEVPLIFNQTFDPGFFISLHNKDLGIAREIHTNHRTQINPDQYDNIYGVNALAEQIYNAAEVKYGPQVGSSMPAKFVQDQTDVAMEQPGFDDWTYEIEKVTSGSIGVVHKNVGRGDAN